MSRKGRLFLFMLFMVWVYTDDFKSTIVKKTMNSKTVIKTIVLYIFTIKFILPIRFTTISFFHFLNG